MATDILTTTRATLPGVYIGRIYRPAPTGLTGQVRLPCQIGKGNRLITNYNEPIRRSFLNEVQMTFSASAPHYASLVYASNNDQTVCQLYKQNGVVIAASKWYFSESTPGSGTYDRVVISPEAYDANATFYLNYQSTSRTVKDELPFSDIREVRFVGDTENQDKYIENVNFAIPVSITTPSGTVTEDAKEFSAVTLSAGTGTATMTINAGTYTHNYNRRYTLGPITIAAGTITCPVSIAMGSGGLSAKPPTPIHTSLASPIASLSFTQGADTTDSFIDPETTDNITMELDDTGTLAVVGDTWTFTGLGPALLEVDSAITNTNQFGSVGTITPNAGNTGTGVVSDSVTSDFSGDHNRYYRLYCSAAAGATPNRTATILWVGYGEVPATQGSISLTETPDNTVGVTLEDDIELDFDWGASNFVVGDEFDFLASAAQKRISAKDSRDYTLTVGTSVAGAVPISYVTNSSDDPFGDATATGDGGYVQLPGGVDFYLRNIGQTLAENRHTLNDEWTWSTVDDETVDWTLDSRQTETISTSDFLTDSLGIITGVQGSTYVILENTPTTVIYVLDTVTGLPVTYLTVSGQPYIYFTTAPSNAISVRYQYQGPEPDPGSIYYFTANSLRPSAYYNTPLLSLTYEEAEALLGPSSTDNDVLIGAQLALDDNDAPGLYTIQAEDSDGDGTVTVTDINTAIEASEETAELTDITVLGYNASLSKALTSNESMNDPFEKKERALWWGLPSGTLIGNIQTPGTIVYTAKKTMQVYGENPAHGTRVLLGNNTATKTITLTDGTQVSVSLDGSFIALAAAAKNASFTSPSSTLLRQNLAGFDSMGVFTEPEELQLVAANVLFLSNQGSTDAPVFRFEESTTVDSSSDDNLEISVSINQKQYVTKDIRTSMDNSLIAVVPPSEQAGVALVRGFLVEKLAQLVASGIIGPYQDDSGNPRPIEPSTDVEVFRASGSKTLYNFRYWYFAQYPLKRLYGLYSVDRKFFGQGS